MLQGLAADIVQQGSSEEDTVGRQATSLGASGAQPAADVRSKTDLLELGSPAKPQDPIELSPAAGKSGAKSGWGFGKASGLLNRWAVPIKIKTEPKAKRAVDEVINLT